MMDVPTIRAGRNKSAAFDCGTEHGRKLDDYDLRDGLQGHAASVQIDGPTEKQCVF